MSIISIYQSNPIQSNPIPSTLSIYHQSHLNLRHTAGLQLPLLRHGRPRGPQHLVLAVHDVSDQGGAPGAAPRRPGAGGAAAVAQPGAAAPRNARPRAMTRRTPT